jgi:hypothetical protein
MWLEEGPAAHGWADDQVWTVARVRTLIGRMFHISYGVSGVTRLLHRMNYSVQMPARRWMGRARHRRVGGRSRQRRVRVDGAPADWSPSTLRPRVSRPVIVTT